MAEVKKEDKSGEIRIKVDAEGKIISVYSEPAKKYSIRIMLNALEVSKNFVLNQKV